MGWRGSTIREDNSPLTLGQLIREDWNTHSRSISMPGFQALVVHRLLVWAARQPAAIGFPVSIISALVNRLLIRNVYGVEIARSTVVGRRLRIGHHQGVILGYDTVIGDDCLVRQNVTLGQSNDEGRAQDQPVVGNGVEFGAGATVIGSITIGDGARIGPGAIVLTNLPAGATAFAPPARIMKARAAPDEATAS